MEAKHERSKTETPVATHFMLCRSGNITVTLDRIIRLTEAIICITNIHHSVVTYISCLYFLAHCRTKFNSVDDSQLLGQESASLAMWFLTIVVRGQTKQEESCLLLLFTV